MPAAEPPSPADAGAVLVVGMPAHVGPIVAAVRAMGLQASEADDPYAAMAELCRWTGRYRSVILSLQGLYREELQLIAAAKRRGAVVAGAGVEVWLADIDGRPAALAEAMRLGADALLVGDGLHRFTVPAALPGAEARVTAAPPRDSFFAAVAPAVAEASPPVAGAEAVAGDEEAGFLDGHGDDSGLSAWHQIAAGSGGRGTRPSSRPAGIPGPDETRRAAVPTAVMAEEPIDEDFDLTPGEPVLTAEELRALLQDEPGGAS